MGMINYKMQKILLFSMTGILPLLVLILLITINMDLILSMVLALLTSTGFIFIGHKLTSQHPFVRAIQEGKVLIWDTPSTGIANVYCADVLTDQLGQGIEIKTEMGDVRAYDRIITNLMSQPFLAKIFFKRQKTEKGIYDNKINIELSNDMYKNAAWHYDNLTVLFYNSQIGSFLTKPLMNQQEKELLAEYLSLNEARELRNLNRTFLELMRHTFDLISSRFSQIFSNPMFQILVVIVILAVLGYVAIQFMPGLSGALGGTVDKLGGQPLSQPLM